MLTYICINCLINIVLCDVIFAHPNNITLENTEISTKVLSRKKRYLVFPPGSILQLGYCLNVPTLIPHGLFFYGITLGTNWELPSETVVRKPHGQAEVVHRRHRRELYNKLIPILTVMGLDGKACILRALCEAGQRPVGKKGSFIEEIIHAFFKLPAATLQHEFEEDVDMAMFDNAHRTKKNCSRAFPTCSTTAMDLLEI